MIPAVNSWIFPRESKPEQQLETAARAGFSGIEPVIGEREALTFSTPASVFTDLARCAADLNLPIVSLATGDFWDASYGDASPEKRQKARDMTMVMLDRAVDLGAPAILVVPAVVGLPDEPRGRVTYADALSRSMEELHCLRHEAAARDVTIGIENVPNRFLLSPVEFADFIDRVNSGYVGVYLDVGNVLPIGYPEDWITTLGHRIRCVHVKECDLTQPGCAERPALGEGSVDWPGVMTALRKVGYDGAMTYEGEGDPPDVCRRLENILRARYEAGEENT